MFIPQLEPPWSDLIDVVLVASMIYALIVWLRDARAHLALGGIAILGVVYFVAQQLGLTLTAWIFQAFFAVFLIILIVIFQEEIRRVFERLALFGRRRGEVNDADDATINLVHSVFRLAGTRQGALIVIPGTDLLDRHVRGGVLLLGELSEPLLLSLFDPGSPGHDGAVIISGNQVLRFAVHLPLSANHDQLHMRGTRHAAALGLAERTDALCIVVSEERGTVSVAQDGELRELPGPSDLTAVIRDTVHAQSSRAKPRTRRLHWPRNWREIGLAVGGSALLWAVVVPGSEEEERIIQAPVAVRNLPEGWVLDAVEPALVDVTVKGLRRELFFLEPRRIEVSLDGFLVVLGRRSFELSPRSVRVPPNLAVSEVAPQRVLLSVSKSPSAVGESQPPTPDTGG